MFKDLQSCARKHHTRGRWLITNVQPDSEFLCTCSWRENCLEGKLRGRGLVPLSRPCGWTLRGAPPPAVLSAANPHPEPGLPVRYWEAPLTVCSRSSSGHGSLSRCLAVVLPILCFRSQCGGVPAARPGPWLELGVRATATGGSRSSARPASAWGLGGGEQLALTGDFLQPGCPRTVTYSASLR